MTGRKTYLWVHRLILVYLNNLARYLLNSGRYSYRGDVPNSILTPMFCHCLYVLCLAWGCLLLPSISDIWQHVFVKTSACANIKLGLVQCISTGHCCIQYYPLVGQVLWNIVSYLHWLERVPCRDKTMFTHSKHMTASRSKITSAFYPSFHIVAFVSDNFCLSFCWFL